MKKKIMENTLVHRQKLESLVSSKNNVAIMPSTSKFIADFFLKPLYAHIYNRRDELTEQQIEFCSTTEVEWFEKFCN